MSLLVGALASGVAAAAAHSLFPLLPGLFGAALTLRAPDGTRARRPTRTADEDHPVTEPGRPRGAPQPPEDERMQGRRPSADLASLAAMVTRGGGGLWHRRPDDADWLRLTVGRGLGRADIGVEGPVTIDVARAGVLGIAVDDDSGAGAARALILQLVAWHGPADLHIRVLASDDAAWREWSWLGLVPHTREPSAARGAGAVSGGIGRPPQSILGHLGDDRAPVAGRPRVVDATTTPAARSSPPPTDVVLLLGAGALCARPGIDRLLYDGPTAGVAILCLDRAADLPVECTTVVVVTDGVARVAGGAGVVRAVADGCRLDVAEEVATHLGHLGRDTPADRAVEHRPPAAGRRGAES